MAIVEHSLASGFTDAGLCTNTGFLSGVLVLGSLISLWQSLL